MPDTFKDKTFGFVMFPGFEELDLVGPWEMATMWRDFAGGPACCTIGQTGEPLTCAKGLRVIPDHAFADAPACDYLLVPGGFATREEAENPAMTGFLAERGRAAEQLLSVCTGSLLLHAAGLLSGRKATTHWIALDQLRATGDVEVVEQRYVNDGNVWTSAGVSAGADMLLAFIAAMAGDEVAGRVQHGAEYYPDPVRYGSAHRARGSPAYVRDAAPD
jgi:transcriptional regulator GlxA family with amidase domain